MTERKLLTPPPYGTTEWVEWRRTRGLGASDIAAILGVSPYMGEFELCLLKRGEIEVADTDRMRWGRRIEGVALDMYEESQPLSGPLVRGETWWTEDYPDIWATLDARHADIGVEVKATGRWRGTVPDHVKCQVIVQAYLAMLSRVDVWRVTAYDVELVTVEPDDATAKGLLDLASDWWERYGPHTSNTPPVDGSQAATRHLARLRGPDAATASAEQAAMLSTLRDIRTARTDLDKREALIVNQIKASMGGTGKLQGDGFGVSWTETAPRVKVNWEGVAKAYRSILEEWDTEEDRLDLEAIEGLHTSMGEASTRFAPHWED